MNDKTELYRAFYELVHTRDWQEWEIIKNDTIPGFGSVEIVSTIEDCRRAYRDTYYSREYTQGSTATAGLVFKVTYLGGDVRYFQKDGTYDSYGDCGYDGGSFFEVKAVMKTVLAYERVDDTREA